MSYDAKKQQNAQLHSCHSIKSSFEWVYTHGDANLYSAFLLHSCMDYDSYHMYVIYRSHQFIVEAYVSICLLNSSLQ